MVPFRCLCDDEDHWFRNSQTWLRDPALQSGPQKLHTLRQDMHLRNRRSHGSDARALTILISRAAIQTASVMQDDCNLLKTHSKLTMT